jgi:hypothetical protein
MPRAETSNVYCAKTWLSQPALYGHNGLSIGGVSIVERWEKPIQELLAKSVCESRNGRVLEIGYGLGFAAKTVAASNPLLHVLVEAHPQVAIKAIKELPPSTSILLSLWELILPSLRSDHFDGILFDAYPMTGELFDGSAHCTLKHVAVAFAEGARLLRPRGVLGFLDFSCAVTELDDFRSNVKEFFSSFQVNRLEIAIPDTCTFARGRFGDVVVLRK